MTGDTPRNRDRLLNSLKRLVSRSPSPGAALQTGPVQPITASTRTDDPFLQDALNKLSGRERLVVQRHVTPDISTTVQAAYDAAADKKNICEQKKWPVSDKADKILRWLDRFKSVGDVIANVDPIHVGLPWAGIRFILEVLVADSRQMSALISGMDLALGTANRLRAYFIYYQRLPRTQTTDNLRKALIALYAHVLRFLAEAIEVFSKSPAVRKVQAFWRDSDLTKFEEECNILAARANTGANDCERELNEQRWTAAARWKHDLNIALQEIDGIQQQVVEKLDALQVKVDLSKLIAVPEAIYNSSSNGNVSICLEGTRSDILDSIQRWVDMPEGKFIFWLRGKAGTGKSTISRTVAQRYDQPQVTGARRRLGASFFFKRGEAKRSNTALFFPTIALQLADLIPQLRAPISTVLDKDSFLCGKDMQEQFEGLILRPLSCLDPSCLPQQRIVIVIDALDECDRSTDIPRFLRLLSQVEAASKVQLRIFLTSRPELPITLGFRELDTNERRDLHHDVVLEDVQEETIGRDIRAYLDDQFAKIRAKFDTTLPRDWPSEDDLQTLVDLAVPLFIFASTICRFVSENKPHKRLNIILAQRYAAVPSHLAKTYLPILNNLLEEKEEDEQNEIIQDFQNVIGPLVLAAEPLSIPSLASLLHIQPQCIGEDFDILKDLHSVLDIPSNMNDPVRLLHLSFRDFLTDGQRKDREAFWIDEVDIHKKLAHHCLRRLLEKGALQSDMCHVARPGMKRSEVPAQQIKIPPDVVYACSYWPLHLIKSRENLIDNSPAHRFLEKHFLHWLEALSWLGRLSNAIAYMSDLLLISRDAKSARVSAFLDDAKRFLLQNRHVIDLAPLQIYHSAVIFTPTESIIRQIFSTQMPQLWARLPRLPTNWSAEVQKLEGHQIWVTAVSFSPDGQVIATAADDRSLRLWNAATGEQTQKLVHRGQATAVAFSPDGQILALASDDCTVQLWSTATGERTWKLGEDHPTGKVASSADGQVVASTSKLRGSYPAAKVAFSEDGQVVASTSTRATEEQMQRFEGNSFEGVTFSADEDELASASSERVVQIWTVATGERKQLQRLEGGVEVRAVALSSDGQIVAWASLDNKVRLWNDAAGPLSQSQKTKGHDDSVTVVDFSPDRGNNIVRLLMAATNPQSQVQKIEGHDDVVKLMNFAPDKRDEMVRLWSAVKGKDKQTKKLEGHLSSVYRMVFSPDGQVMATLSGDRSMRSDDHIVRVWNVATGEPIQELRGHVGRVKAVTFSPDGQVIASASCDGTVRLWNVATGKRKQIQTQKAEGHDDYVNAVAFSPDGQVIASADADATVLLWDVAKGEQMHKLEGHTGDVESVAFSPDGKIIASGSDDKTVVLWDVAKGEQMRKFEGHTDDVNVVAFSPDGKSIASCSDGPTVQVWNVETGEQMQMFEGGSGWAKAMVFSPDGQSIAMICLYYTTVRVWSVVTGEQMHELEGHDKAACAVAFSPDGTVIATASYDGTVRLWSAATGEMVRLVPDVNTATIAFSADGNFLQTDTGMIPLQRDVPASPADTCGEKFLKLRDDWISNQDEDLLWLPHEYRESCSAMHEETLAIGHASGGVSIFRLK